MSKQTEVIVLGAGIGGLTLALSLHQAGIACRVYEAVPELKPLGVGINLLPHAARELSELGLLAALDAVGVRTKESVFFNAHGQLVFREAAGTRRGLRLAPVLDPPRRPACRAARRRRASASARTRVVCGHRCTGVDQDDARRHRAFHRAGRLAAAQRARRRRGGLRRHPLGAAQAVLSRRRRAALLGRQHVARHRAGTSLSCRARAWSAPAGSTRARW